MLRDSICSGVEPFRGPLFNQEGKEIIGDQQTLSLEQIINMDWLVENVVGRIPLYDELDDTGKARRTSWTALSCKECSPGLILRI